MMPIYEYMCLQNHQTEEFCDYDKISIECPICHNFSFRVLSVPEKEDNQDSIHKDLNL